nr:MAG TPA: hypothetical protein [Bacteriophage sp.]
MLHGALSSKPTIAYQSQQSCDHSLFQEQQSWLGVQQYPCLGKSFVLLPD